LHVKGVEKGKKIKAYNLAGQKAAEWQSDATGVYDFEGPNGVYFVTPDGEKTSEKVVVLK